jgi:hypothetical protein
MPSGTVAPERRYASRVKVLVDGEWTVPGFKVVASQHGDAPWNEEARPSAPKP